jgi:hypothetical protein
MRLVQKKAEKEKEEERPRESLLRRRAMNGGGRWSSLGGSIPHLSGPNVFSVWLLIEVRSASDEGQSGRPA